MARRLAVSRCLLLALCVVSERPEIPSQSSGPIRIGDRSHGAVQVEDDALEAAHVRVLRETILNITQRDINGDFTTGLAEKVFSNAYTFVVEGTLDGLAHVADSLGIPAAPLDAFLDKIDSKCTAYVLNAVVLNASTISSEEPWHDFAVQIHFDTTLSQLLRNRFLEIQEFRDPLKFRNYGAARTVTILYLNDVTTGGEIQVFDFLPSQIRSDSLVDTCQQAAKRCQNQRSARTTRKKSEKRNCEIVEVDAALEGRTLGSLKPREGRLVQFDGRYAHAVRTFSGTNKSSTSAGKSNMHVDDSGLRISLVLEQFEYPPKLVKKTPTCWVTYNKQPFYARDDLRDRFAEECLPNSQCQPKAFGSPSVDADVFRRCMDSGRAKASGKADEQTASPETGVPLYRTCLKEASLVKQKRRRRKPKKTHRAEEL